MFFTGPLLISQVLTGKFLRVESHMPTFNVASRSV
jgi:hypothetical protein